MVQAFRATRRTTVAIGIVAATRALALIGCAAGKDPAARSVTLTVWHHDGQATERAAMTEQAGRFNAAQNDIVVNVIEVPEAGYADHIQLADSALYSSTDPLALFAQQLIAAKKIDTDSTANHGYEAIR
jgi:ABC-type glycerol-3-phosphate transport system substrate-binding protein